MIVQRPQWLLLIISSLTEISLWNTGKVDLLCCYNSSLVCGVKIHALAWSHHFNLQCLTRIFNLVHC